MPMSSGSAAIIGFILTSFFLLLLKASAWPFNLKRQSLQAQQSLCKERCIYLKDDELLPMRHLLQAATNGTPTPTAALPSTPNADPGSSNDISNEELALIIALTLGGLMMMILGVLGFMYWEKRHERRLRKVLHSALPPSLRDRAAGSDAGVCILVGGCVATSSSLLHSPQAKEKALGAHASSVPPADQQAAALRSQAEIKQQAGANGQANGRPAEDDANDERQTVERIAPLPSAPQLQSPGLQRASPSMTQQRVSSSGPVLAQQTSLGMMHAGAHPPPSKAPDTPVVSECGLRETSAAGTPAPVIDEAVASLGAFSAPLLANVVALGSAAAAGGSAPGMAAASPAALLYTSSLPIASTSILVAAAINQAPPLSTPAISEQPPLLAQSPSIELPELASQKPSRPLSEASMPIEDDYFCTLPLPPVKEISDGQQATDDHGSSPLSDMEK